MRVILHPIYLQLLLILYCHCPSLSLSGFMWISRRTSWRCFTSFTSRNFIPAHIWNCAARIFKINVSLGQKQLLCTWRVSILLFFNLLLALSLFICITQLAHLLHINLPSSPFKMLLEPMRPMREREKWEQKLAKVKQTSNSTSNCSCHLVLSEQNLPFGQMTCGFHMHLSDSLHLMHSRSRFSLSLSLSFFVCTLRSYCSFFLFYPFSFRYSSSFARAARERNSQSKTPSYLSNEARRQ